MQKKTKAIAISSVCSLILIGACVGAASYSREQSAFDPNNGWYVLSEKKYEKCMMDSNETFENLKNDYYQNNNSDWYVLSEAIRTVNQKIGESMPIDSYCANWGYETGKGRTVMFYWMSGDKYYSKEFSCWNYTEDETFGFIIKSLVFYIIGISYFLLYKKYIAQKIL